MLKSILKELDPTDKTKWTADGQPRVDVIGNMLGKEVTRKEISEALMELQSEAEDKQEVTAEPENPIPALEAQLNSISAQIKALEAQREPLQRQMEHFTRMKRAYDSSEEARVKRMKQRQINGKIERQKRMDRIEAMKALQEAALGPMSPLDKALKMKQRQV